jgi:hypothetical protein
MNYFDKMRFRSISLQVLVLLLSISCSSKRETSEPEKIANSFFATYAKEGPNKAVRELFSANKYITSQDTDTVAIGLERFSKNLGDYRGTELIAEGSYGKDISLLSYAVKYARQPMRFKFTFYNPGNGWILHDFRYETNFLHELDETVKAYRLRENLDLEED